MYWVLTIPTDFSIGCLLQRSAPLLLPPFSVVRQQRLERVEHLSSGKTLLISLRQIPAGLHLHSDQGLSGAEAEEVSQKVWHMLRLGENFSGFCRLLGDHPTLKRCLTSGYRFLRGSTFFEDIVKAQVLAYRNPSVLADMTCGAGHNGTENGTRRQCLTALIDHLGSPLATNPTRHAFPTPEQVFAGQAKVNGVLGPALGEMVVTTAERFVEAPTTLAELLRRDVPLPAVKQTLRTFPGMSAPMVGLAMLALGRYDYFPLESYSHVLLRHAINASNGELSKIQALFARWHPWAGLTYWLWDWQSCPLSVVLEEDIFHEKTTC